MSYASPDILLIDSPTGLDAVIQDLQQDLATLPWLGWSFGRAWEHKEVKDGKLIRIPKAYLGNGEYHNVLPNDFCDKGQSFFAAKDTERPIGYQRFVRNELNRTLSNIFWVNLQRINPEKGYIYTEELKEDVLKIYKASDHVVSIVQYVDERVEHVYDAWTREALYARYTIDESNPYLMYPYGGFRFDIVVSYLENC